MTLLDSANERYRSSLLYILSMPNSAGRDVLRYLIDGSAALDDPMRNNPTFDPIKLAYENGKQTMGRELLEWIADVDPISYGRLIADGIQEREIARLAASVSHGD